MIPGRRPGLTCVAPSGQSAQRALAADAGANPPTHRLHTRSRRHIPTSHRPFTSRSEATPVRPRSPWACALRESAMRCRCQTRDRRLQAKEEPVAQRQRKARYVEYRMVRARQPVKRQHPQHRRHGCRKDRQLESDRHKGRPTVERPPADVERIMDHRRIPLHEKPAKSPEQSPHEHDRRNPIAVIPEGLRQPVQRGTACTLPSSDSHARERAGSPR